MKRKRAIDPLIQTRLPTKLMAWVEKQSEDDGITVAAWVRRLIMDRRSQGSPASIAKRLDRLERASFSRPTPTIEPHCVCGAPLDGVDCPNPNHTRDAAGREFPFKPVARRAPP